MYIFIKVGTEAGAETDTTTGTAGEDMKTEEAVTQVPGGAEVEAVIGMLDPVIMMITIMIMIETKAMKIRGGETIDL